MNDTAQIVARLHGLLVEQIRARRPEYLKAPFTVAEIYQNLVPYAAHRDRLGVEMNGDYEDALVRLLAGEGDYLILESEAALRDLREELESSNPNTGIYREFAAVDVRLNPSATPEAAKPAPAPTETAQREPASQVRMPLPDQKPPAGRGASSGSAPEAAPGGTCRWCKSELPARDGLRFCPFCGADVNVVPCPQCGEGLEPDWRFCIACGAEVPER